MYVTEVKMIWNRVPFVRNYQFITMLQIILQIQKLLLCKNQVVVKYAKLRRVVRMLQVLVPISHLTICLKISRRLEAIIYVLDVVRSPRKMTKW